MTILLHYCRKHDSTHHIDGALLLRPEIIQLRDEPVRLQFDGPIEGHGQLGNDGQQHNRHQHCVHLFVSTVNSERSTLNCAKCGRPDTFLCRTTFIGFEWMVFEMTCRH